MTQMIRCAAVCTVGTLFVASLACSHSPSAPSVPTTTITAPATVADDPAPTPPAPPAAAPHVNVHGTVSGIDAAARTFVVDGRTVRVTDTTVITDTEEGPRVFADIANGMNAHVKGPVDAGVVVATTVSIKTVVVHVREEDFAGTVTAIAGTCPAASFTIATGIIRSDAETEFIAGGACAEVATSSLISGRGLVQEDGSILASRMRVDAITSIPTPVRPGDVSGAASAVTGSCPALTFTVGTQAVKTTADTKFIGSGDCTLIVNGKHVEVTGPFTGGGSVALGPILATRVKVMK